MEEVILGENEEILEVKEIENLDEKIIE